MVDRNHKVMKVKQIVEGISLGLAAQLPAGAHNLSPLIIKKP